MSADFYPEYDILVGVNGTGKSHFIRQILLAHFQRVLVVPSSVYDLQKSWGGFHVIKPSVKQVFNRKNPKKPNVVWFVPGLDRINRPTVLDLSELRTSNEVKEVVESITSNMGDGFENGYLVIDDLKNNVPSSGDLPFMFKQMLISRRQRKVHLAFAVHSISQVNPALLDYGPQFILFKTDRAPSDEVLKKFNNPEIFEQCRLHVNEMALSNGHYYQPIKP